ncbi:MAG: hypothetical protein HC892_10000 [Saprospiraceae bacterium]|nr:hypothetical protein [Saprospiraceae bacterium]
MDGRLEQSKQLEAFYAKHKIAYIKLTYGSSIIIDNGLRKFKYWGLSGDESMKGVHLCRMVNKFLIDEKPKVKEYDKKGFNIPTNFYVKNNLDIKKKICLYSFDLNSCYWTTAFNLGFISKKIYNNGIKGGSEFKEARNIALGTLAKRVTAYVFDGAKGHYEDNYNYEFDYLANYRHAIVEHVLKIAIELYQLYPMIFIFSKQIVFISVQKYQKKLVSLFNPKVTHSKNQ